jgi:hypothetical protein
MNSHPQQLPSKNIELIEDLPLTGTDRWYVLLAYTGQKQASWLSLESDVWRQGDTPRTISQERLDEIKAVFDELGLFYRLRMREATDAGLWQPDKNDQKRTRLHQMCDIFVATTQEKADELSAAVEAGDHKRIGYALDYPATAVEAFDIERGPQVDWGKMREEIDEEVMDAAQFIPSKEHYKEEYAQVKEWLDTLKANSTIIAI